MVRSVTYNKVTTGATTGGAAERCGPRRQVSAGLRHKEALAPQPSLTCRQGRRGRWKHRSLTFAGSDKPQALLSSLSTRPEQEWKSPSPTCWRVLGAHHGLCLPDVEGSWCTLQLHTSK